MPYELGKNYVHICFKKLKIIAFAHFCMCKTFLEGPTRDLKQPWLGKRWPQKSEVKERSAFCCIFSCAV